MVGLKKVLSPKELKNVIGGSNDPACIVWPNDPNMPHNMTCQAAIGCWIETQYGGEIHGHCAHDGYSCTCVPDES